MLHYLNILQEKDAVPLCYASYSKFGVKPFLKWPGGKRWLSKKLSLFISTRLEGRYYEPFLGGGAIFFALQPRKATLSDINEDLINTFIQVRDNPCEIIRGLKKIHITKEDYYRIRSEEPADSIDKAIRFIYLNRTSFSGIYRLNKNGKFNVPYGGGKRTLELLWRDGLIEKASKTLQETELLILDFEKIMNGTKNGDVIYCDPTYITSHNNNGFIRYNEKNFSWMDQKRLALAAIRACQRGSLVIVSNANCLCLNDMYYPFKPIVLKRKSLISPKREARRDVYESLFILDPSTYNK